MNFGPNMLKQAQQLQARMAKLKEELGAKSYEASSGGGAVSITATGDFKIQKVSIKAELLQGGDAAMLEDLVLTAANQALGRAQEDAATAMSKLTGGFKLPF